MPLLGFAALRASGGQEAAQQVPIGLLANLLGALLLLGGFLSAGTTNLGAPTSVFTAIGLLIASLLALGVPPLHRSSADIALAPANVAAPLLAFGLPLLAGHTLIRFASQTALDERWRLVLQIGGVAVLAICGAAALGTRHLRQIVAWQASAQAGLLLLTLGLGQVAAATIAPALLLNASLVTATALIATGLIERRAGTDRLDAIQLSAPLVLPGLAFAIAAASAVGVPGTWGFWILRWLFAALASSPFLIGPLFSGAALLALAWLLPLVAFLRAPAQPNAPRPTPNPLAQALPALLALPFLILGVAPGLAWNGWGATAREVLLPTPFSTPPTPFLPHYVEMLACAASGLLLLGLFVLARRSTRRTLADPEQQTTGVLLPTELANNLRPLGWAGDMAGAFGQLWAGVLGPAVA